MSESQVVDQAGRVLGDRYRLIALIGIGASGEVYLADDTQLRRQVAVKVLHRALAEDEVFLRRFRAEARTAASLTHPNIVAVHDWGEDDVPYIVTEYLSGGSLRAMLDRRGVLSPSQALLIGLEVSSGLEYAHRRGVVQRDIKPANILFDGEGRVRIADFGLAKALAEASATEPGGHVLGTIRYASPEQAQGRRVGTASDVYSLGLVLLEIVTGTLPFDADTPIATLMARVDQPVEPDASLGVLRGPIERACRIDATLRPDAGELRVALLAAAESLPRPEPLPLVGAISFDAATDGGRDHTMIAGDPDAGPVRSDPNRDLEANHDDTVTGPRRRRRAVDDPVEEEVTRRRRWPAALLALLLLAGVGVGTYVALQPDDIATDVVPDAVGMTPEELRAQVGDFWLLDDAEAREDGSEPGTILRTEPAAGVDLAEGETLVYFVSLGNAMRMVPTTDELAGLTLGEAAAILERDGLTIGESTGVYDEVAPIDTVLEVAETARELPTGEAVDVVVSLGPRPRVVPDSLVGLSFVEAESQLAVESLVATRTEVFDDEIAQGIVIRVRPRPGTEVARDSSVELVVSKGPEPVVIPDVVGSDVPTAASVLRGAGLCIGDTDGPPDTTVIATDPAAGQTVERGFCVRIVTSEFG